MTGDRDLSLRKTIAHGSKSFFFASLFFPRGMREACWTLYRWCRHCDDVIDHAPNRAAAEAALRALRMETERAFTQASTSAVFADVGEICRRYEIPRAHLLELLAGFEKDVTETKYETIEDVEAYAFQVAGVVGLMMAKIMGANDAAADGPAKDLGIAMQLTNIARDVAEDFANGRVYLPSQWLHDEGVDATHLLEQNQRAGVYRVVSRLLAHADDYYHSGRAGLRYLPWRARVSIAMASLIYAEIGHKILRAGPSALDTRVHVTLREKLRLAAQGVWMALPQTRSARLQSRT